LTMAQGRSSIETYHVSTLERPELPTKTAEPWWPLQFADVLMAAQVGTALHSHSSGLLIPSLRLQSHVLRSQSRNGIWRGSRFACDYRGGMLVIRRELK
jgi:hypothetical protein